MDKTKLILNQDIYLHPPFSEKIKILNKGDIFNPNEDNKYTISYLDVSNKYTIDEMLNQKSEDGLNLFSIDSDVEVIIQELPDDDDNLIKNWRIQLDVKTTKKKLKEIEKIVNEKIKPLL
jgi:hypothetical protein